MPTFTLPLPPNLNRNRHTHWAVTHREKRAWYDAADTAQCRHGFPRPPATPWMHVHVTAIMTMPSVMDHDNALRRASKWPMDWLVSRGYLHDDAPKHVTWLALPEQRISRREPATLVLTLTPVAREAA